MKAIYFYLLRLLLLSFLFIPFLGCQKESLAQDNERKINFATQPVATKINPGIIDEASGIADTRPGTGYLWVQQDSGNPNDIFLLSYTGEIFKKINIKPATNRDWEDICVSNGPAPGVRYIYLADIGDNARAFATYTIYRFHEPAITIDTVFTVDQLRFQYPDGSHDAEAILVEPVTRDIYILTKQDTVSGIYKLPYPQAVAAINTAIYVGSLPFKSVVSAASSAAGDELLIKTYSSLYYWGRNGAESLEQTLAKPPVVLNYVLEPQGEAVCFKSDNKGFYTLSEKPSFAAQVSLNFYERK